MEIFFRLIKLAFLLAIVALCLLGCILNSQSGVFREFQVILLSLQWTLPVCMVAWSGCFLFLTFSLKDLPLIGLLLIAMAVYFISYAATLRIVDAIILLTGVMLGKGTRFQLHSGKSKTESRNISDLQSFLIGLVMLLAFSSCWHLNMTGPYHGPRWMGLWNNPNIYGILMGAGLVLAAGTLIGNSRSRGNESHCKNPKSKIGKWRLIRVSLRRPLPVFLFIAAGVMAVGLLFSYSRGAWVGSVVGLLFLAKAHDKLKWRPVLLGIFVVAVVVGFFWHSTADEDRWYLKRLDLSRPSAQHRVSAWRGAVQIMRDHPLGVGWDKAVGVYGKNYSPPQGGAGAITMNSYLMLGSELGLPGLLCFVAYVGLCLRGKCEMMNEEGRIQAACRAGAIVFVVAFWFDGGLFDLPTAAVFWILLELGSYRPIRISSALSTPR